MLNISLESQESLNRRNRVVPTHNLPSDVCAIVGVHHSDVIADVDGCHNRPRNWCTWLCGGHGGMCMAMVLIPSPVEYDASHGDMPDRSHESNRGKSCYDVAGSGY